LSRAGLEVIHHELSEFPTLARLHEAVRLGLATSIGLSLSELYTLTNSRGDPGLLAQQIASQYGPCRVIVHADHWALSVHQGDPEHQKQILVPGNAFAAARATNGRPTAILDPVKEAVFAADLPPSGVLGDGWQATCVPAPYLHRPASTIGLGDTFCAGALLGESLFL